MKPLFALLLLNFAALGGGAAPLLAPQEQETITEISLEVTRGNTSAGESYGRAFKITLRRDGTALFTGKANVNLIGEYRSTIAPADFNRLAEFLEAHKYSQIKSNLLWTAGISGGSITSAAIVASTVITSVKTTGKRKTIRRASNDLDSANENTMTRGKVPIELLDIEAAITDTAMSLQWVKVSR